MTSIVTITNPNLNSGSPIRIICSRVMLNGTKNINKTPSANSTNQTTVQTNAFENIIYSIPSVYLTGAASTLAYTDILYLYRAKYDNTSATTTTLNVTYDGNKTLVGVMGTSGNIKVVLESFSFPLDMESSKDSYIPAASLTFVETA